MRAHSILAITTFLASGACTPKTGLPSLQGEASCAEEVPNLCSWASRYDGVILGEIKAVVGIVEPLANDTGLVTECTNVEGTIALELGETELLFGRKPESSSIRIGYSQLGYLFPTPLVDREAVVTWFGEGNRLGSGMRMAVPFVELADEKIAFTELPLIADSSGVLEVQGTCDSPLRGLTAEELVASLRECEVESDSASAAQLRSLAETNPMATYAAACVDSHDEQP